MIFKQQLANISTVLNNTGNTTKLLTSFNALDVAQQKVLLSSSLLSEKQKEQCITMATLSAANTKYTAEQLAKATGVSVETFANWGLVESTDALTISQLAEKASSDAQAKTVLDKIIAQNAQAVANGEVTISNIAIATSEASASLATGAFTTAIKANISAMWIWMTTTPLGQLTLLATGVFAAVKAYDALTVSVEEQKEKVEKSLSAYEDAKSELSGITSELENQEQAMDDLLAKDKLNNVPANTTISLTYNPKIITCSNTLYQKNIYTDSSIWNKKWLTFLQGINQLNLCGDINTITLSYQVAKAVF